MVPWREPRHSANTLIMLRNRNTASGYTNENTNILSEFLRIYAVSSEHKGPPRTTPRVVPMARVPVALS
jgi:hypothetical protein